MDVFKSTAINKVQFKNLVQGGSNVVGIKQLLTHAALNENGPQWQPHSDLEGQTEIK